MSKFAAAVAPNATSAESADPAVSRFLDAVWMERGLSANTLAAYRADLTSLARWLAERDVSIMKTSRADLLGLHRLASAYRRAPAFHGAPAVQLQTLLSLLYARRRGPRGPDRADRHAEDRPLAAEVGDRGGGRGPARRADGLRSARQPRSHHARGAVCHGPAGLGAGEPAHGAGEPEPGRPADPRQGQPRTLDPVGWRVGQVADQISRAVRAARSCSSGRRTISSPRDAAIA